MKFQIFDRPIGDHKNIAEIFLDIHDPIIPKENDNPLRRS